MMRSAHSTRETNTPGLPNFAAQTLRSLSETPRAREQAPQENTGMCLATTFSRNSLSGGQPMGITASDVALRIRFVASAVKKIWTSCPASDRARAWANTNEARVGSSVPHELLIKTFRTFFEPCAFIPTARNGSHAKRDKKVRVFMFPRTAKSVNNPATLSALELNSR